MANEKKNGTLEEVIMEMLKEGKAVRIPIKDVVDKLQENVKAAEDALETVQPETEKSEAVPQGGQVKTVPISIHIDNLHIKLKEEMKKLDKIEMVRQLDNIYRLDHAVTANQKVILKAFGLDANSIKYFASELSKELKKAEADVIAAKKKYDQATANLKELLDKRDAIRKEEILSAVVKSGRSYEEIMNFLNAGSDGEKTEK